MKNLETVQRLLREEEMTAELNDGFVTTYIKCGLLGAQMKVSEERRVLKVLILTGIFAPPHKRAAMAEAITRANFGLPFGAFELDYSDGEIRFRASVPKENIDLPTELIKHLMFGAWSLCGSYTQALVEVAVSNVPPAVAIALAEGKKTAAEPFSQDRDPQANVN